MYLLFHFAIPLISSLIAIGIIIFFFFCRIKSKYQPSFKNAVPVIEVMKTLAKICPINSLNKWLLLPLDSGSQRCWMQTLLFPVMTKSMNLYGSSGVINSSSVVVGSLIVDITKWADWNPFYSSQFIVKYFHDKQHKSDHYMEAEQIFSIVQETDKIHSDTFMFRFHNISENKVVWILFWHAKRLEFLFFLIQPVKNKKESSQCVLTHIMGTDVDTLPSATLVLQRIRNIKDLLTLSSVILTPLKLTSSPQSNTGESIPQNEVQSLSSSHENFFSLPAARARKRGVQNSMYILVPFETSTFWFWRKKGFKLGVKNIDNELETKLLTSFKQRHRSKNELNLKNPIRRVMSDVGFKHLNFINSSRKSEITYNKNEIQNLYDKKLSSESKESIKKLKRLSDTSEDSEEICSSKTFNQLKVKDKMISNVKLQSFPGNALDDDFFHCETQNKLNYESVMKLQNVTENAEDKVLAIDNEDQKEIFSSSISDFEVLDCFEYTENRLAEFMTQGNYGASELQAEVLLASQLKENFNSNNFQSTVGWMFHSHYKGLAVLSKSTPSQYLKISSFLCQIELPVNPKDVWKFVKNPQFRFICDETVKNVEVLEKISSSQKLSKCYLRNPRIILSQEIAYIFSLLYILTSILLDRIGNYNKVHTYHEIGGLLRKELVDFCLLQTEREELNKYYSCFYSIEFDRCPFMKSVTRGTLRPSGWIVEESDNGVGKSKITYMIQILVNSPDSLLIQELSILVPQSVLNLKNYITSKPM